MAAVAVVEATAAVKPARLTQGFFSSLVQPGWDPGPAGLFLPGPLKLDRPRPAGTVLHSRRYL
jgi:hypothetical protein